MEAQRVPLGEEIRQVMERVSVILRADPAAPVPVQQLVLFEHIATNLRRFGATRDAPIQSMLGHVGNFWSNAVLCSLLAGPLRPSAMQKVIAALTPQQAISGRMLTLNLRALEADGLIQREVRDIRNPHVEYRLTSLGDALSRLIFSIIEWASEHHQQIVDARERYVPPHPSMRPRQRGWRT